MIRPQWAIELEAINAAPYELALVVPVVLGLKPASIIVILPDDDDPAKIAQSLQGMGLFTKEMAHEKYTEILLARDAQTLEKIIDYKKNHFLDDRLMGEILGYPETAIDGFLKKDFHEQEDPEDMFRFRLSGQNWREEIKVLNSWNDAVKKYTPKIYQEFMKMKFF